MKARHVNNFVITGCIHDRDSILIGVDLNISDIGNLKVTRMYPLTFMVYSK